MASHRDRNLRTTTQIEANALDIALFRLRERVDAFAVKVNSSSLAMDAMQIGRARQLVWQYMHPDDRAALSQEGE